MKLVVNCIFLLAVNLPWVFGRMAFPVGVEYKVEEVFQDVNRNLKWDDSNLLVDEAGPYAVCQNVDKNGFVPVKPHPLFEVKYGKNNVAALVSDTDSTGLTVSGVSTDIYEIAKQWIRKDPFRSQISSAQLFGCSVQPGCRGRTVVACLFTPAAEQMSGDWQPRDPDQVSLAFTREQYLITERVFGTYNPSVNWDRSHFLENLSGFETRCSMIGQNSWDYSVVKKKALEYNYDVGLLFGWTKATDNADKDIDSILRSWTKYDKERNQIKIAKEVGCSVVQTCANDILVISCLISPAL